MAAPNAETYRIPDETARAFQNLRQGAKLLRQLPAAQKDALLTALAERVLAESDRILEANKFDLENLPPTTTSAFRDRLTLNPKRLEAIAESLRQVAALPDPVGEVVESRTLANGLKLRRVRSPLGVIFMIFESRPNVILEAFSLAFKSGNAIALRGGSDSRATAGALYTIVAETLLANSISPDVFLGMSDYDRRLVAALLERKDWIDITVPRGGDKLIEFVSQTARMPIIKNDRGMCHVYVDIEADLDMATKIVLNAKTQRPGVCNAAETVLVHAKIAEDFLPRLHQAAEPLGLQWRCDEASLKILGSRAGIQPAQAADWDTEHLDLILNAKVVPDFGSAVFHIEKHGSRHSEAIITRNEEKARLFQVEVDAAAVYWNASTRFTDGFEMGLGGELGISTQKLHVRGPVGLRELTTPRWIGDGTGQVRS